MRMKIKIKNCQPVDFRFNPTVLVLIVCIFISCNALEPLEEYVNDEDPENDKFVKPTITIIEGPSNGEVIDDHSIRFEWIGNRDDMEFSINANNDGWEPWNSNTSALFEYLDDALYSIQVKSRYLSGAESDPSDVISYEIDAVHGPAFKFYPRRVMAEINTNTTIDLYVEEVSHLSGVDLTIEYDPSYLTVYDYRFPYWDNLLTSNGGDILQFISEDTTGIINARGVIVGGDENGVDGTGKIMYIQFSPRRTGSSLLTISGYPKMRTPDNQVIEVVQTVDCLVIVE